MTPEQKDILLKDLCARLPYGVKIALKNNGAYHHENIAKKGDVTIDILKGFNGNYFSIRHTNPLDWDWYDDYIDIEDIKPYLFPLSSMTEEQYNEMQTISGKDCMEHMEIEKEWRNNSPFTHLPLYQHRVIEFFHKYHFDYRGLIPMGLANDATGKNIY